MSFVADKEHLVGRWGDFCLQVGLGIKRVEARGQWLFGVITAQLQVCLKRLKQRIFAREAWSSVCSILLFYGASPQVRGCDQTMAQRKGRAVTGKNSWKQVLRLTINKEEGNEESRKGGRQ